jgi:VCBS repeat protein/centrosomal CEP192-like protein
LVAGFALIAGVASSLAQAPPPVNFVSGQLFSGAGNYDRIPGAAGVIALAVGDFNNDGKLDLVMTNSDTNNNGLGLVLGNGDGTFQAPLRVADFNSYGSMGGSVAGDFNKDGNLDFAAAIDLNNLVQVVVYLGDGLGHFTLNNTYSIGGVNSHPPFLFATADVNGDANLDLIVPDVSNGAVAVLYGKGDGTFPNATEFPAAVPGVTAPGAVAVGDFNKDGKPDLVVASYTGCCPLRGGIHVLLDNGTGGFQAPVFYANPGGVDSLAQVAVADLNADGKLDVAESTMGGQNLAIFLGNGDGTFQPVKTYFTIWGSALAVGNLSSDKKPEIVVTSYYDGTAWVWLNKGSGVFQLSGMYSTDGGAQALALADFNKDGKLDLVTGNSSGQYFTVALGNGDGTFRSSPHYNDSGGWTTGFAVADFNLDGNPDVVQAGGGTAVGLSIMLGSSHGVLKAPTYINLGANSYAIVAFALAGDLNGDGKPDIVSSTAEGYGNPYGVAILLGTGTGTFKPALVYTTSTSSYPAQGVLVDVNGDGKVDIVTSNFDASLSVLLNKGKGTYGAPLVTPGVTADPSWIAAADFNADGKLDLVLTDYGAVKTHLLLGNGNGTFQTPTVIFSSLRPTAPAIVGDFNKDGKLDLAILSSDAICAYCGGSMAILLGNGNGTFTTGNTYYFYDQYSNFTGGFVPTGGAAVDLNGDGKPDLAIAVGNPRYNLNGAYRAAEQYMGGLVFLGNGNGTFMQQSGWLAGAWPAFVAAADFNSDGMPDLAFLSNNLNYGQTSLTILQNATQPVSVSPLSINYGNKVVGTSTAQTIVLTNDQTTSLTISSINLGGTNPGEFAYKSACGTHVSSGANCIITVTFKPVGVDTRTASLFIHDSVGTQSVALRGVSTEVKISPTSLPFGGVTVGQQKTLSVTLTNVGSTVMSIVSPGITITGTSATDYSQTNTCGTSVVAGGNCTISVTFKPSKTGSRGATLNINDNGGLSPQKVPLSGSGI